MLATRRRFVATLTAAFMLLAVPASAGGLTDGDRADAGAAYLTTQQKPNGSIPAFSPIGSTADAVLAFVASDTESPSRKAALGYLRTQVQKGNVNTVGLVAKVVQAVAAAGRDPRSFGGEDLVQWLRSRIKDEREDRRGDGLRPGAGDPGARGGRGEARSGPPRDWLLAAQCPVGGWSYDNPYRPAKDDDSCWNGGADDFFTADTNTTSYVVMALEHVGRDSYTDDPFAFFRSARDAVHEGWEYSPGFGTDANSTALVIQAYAAAELGGPVGRPERAPGAPARRGAAAPGPTTTSATSPATRTWAPRSAPCRRSCRCRCRSSRRRPHRAERADRRARPPRRRVRPRPAAAGVRAGGDGIGRRVRRRSRRRTARRPGRRHRWADAHLLRDARRPDGDRSPADPARVGAQHGLQYRLGFGGQAVCQLAGVGPTGGDCFADYPDFWGYWHGNGGGGWTWAGSGAASASIGDGDVEGWTWGSGDSGATHPAPPALSIDDVCDAATEPPPGDDGGGGPEAVAEEAVAPAGGRRIRRWRGNAATARVTVAAAPVRRLRGRPGTGSAGEASSQDEEPAGTRPG